MIEGLHDYLKHNQAYLTNYDQRHNLGQAYTSQVAESHIHSLLNARPKRKRKIQWTRQGADNVLPIRAKMASQEWNQQWQNTVLEALIGSAQKNIA